MAEPLQDALDADGRVSSPMWRPKAIPPKGRIIYDGLNLALLNGTGIATYTRMLAGTACSLGYDVGVVYETPFSPAGDSVLQDILFFDRAFAPPRSRKKSLFERAGERLIERFHPRLAVEPTAIELGEAVDVRQFADRLAACDRIYAARDVFHKASRYFISSGNFLSLNFDTPPDIFHCTYAIPAVARNARNLYTIHDLVPLRLPHATLDNKREIYGLFKAIAKKADHIVTVSESSKRDIVEILGFDEDRITNTYQAVVFPEEYLTRTDAVVANYLAGQHGLEMQGYLLFFGALEPKKNVGRLIDAYLSSGVDIPLVLVTSDGWQNTLELARLRDHEARADGPTTRGGGIRRVGYTSRSNLINLIRGARAVVFPSLLEGFGLPVLEAMTLGTPVITSNYGALREIAGDAALLVDPYDVDSIARAIITVSLDRDVGDELKQRGLTQADKFSPRRYSERVETLYAALS